MKCIIFDYLHPKTWQCRHISHICAIIVCFGLLVSPVTIPFSGTLMRDNIEGVFVTRGKKGDFVTKLSLNFKGNVQCVEIVSIDAQIS